MKVYILTGDYNMKSDTNIFSTVDKALSYANATICKDWQEKNANIDICKINQGFQILITDKYDELIATYFILEKEIDEYV